MFAFMRVTEGLLIAHLVLCLSFLVGSTVFPWCDRDDALDLTASQIMMRVVATCGFGLALLGFLAFVLALVSMLRPAMYFFALGVVVVVAGYVGGAGPLFTTRFWKSRWFVVSNCWNGSTLVVYYAMIMLAFPAIVANFGGSDPVAYHLVYALEWSHAGRLIVDPFLRLPFYANNFLLLYAVLMSVGGGVFVNFLSWATALLAALGICASVCALLDGYVASFYASLAAISLAFAVNLSPVNLRWMDTAYIDTAIGAFALFSLLCIVIAISERHAGWLAVGAATAGFLIGMKGSFIALVPVYLGILGLAIRDLKVSKRTGFAILALLLVTGAPWYARNLILAGDPTPPVFNIMLYGTDGLMTKGEWRQNESDLGTPKTPPAIIGAPLNAFLYPQSHKFREYGVTALMLLLYAPAVLLLIAFATRRKLGAATLICALFVSLLAMYWLFTSSLLRYATLLYPSLAVAVVYALSPFLSRRRIWGPVIAVASLLAIVPSPGSVDYFHQEYISRYRFLPSSYLSDDYFLRRFSPDYAEVQYTSRLVKWYGIPGPVYTLGPRVQYNFLQNGITAIGDWMGPGGYFRLYRAVDARKAPEYLRMLGVHAVLIDPRKNLTLLTWPLEEQLTAAGFCAVPLTDSADQLYMRSQRLCKEIANHKMSFSKDAVAEAKSE